MALTKGVPSALKKAVAETLNSPRAVLFYYYVIIIVRYNEAAN